MFTLRTHVLHTSTVLESSDFSYSRAIGNEQHYAGFSEFLPNYHIQDRIGVVAPDSVKAIRGTGLAILAIATAFYDDLRGRNEAFFDYPQNLAFMDPEMGPCWADSGSAWGWLDVWPDTNWIARPGNATDMIDGIFSHQVNRVFWPEGLKMDESVDALPDYALEIMRRRLKSVHYYRSATPDWTLTGSEKASEIICDSLGKLGTPESPHTPPESQHFKSVSIDDFLDAQGACFSS